MWPGQLRWKAKRFSFVFYFLRSIVKLIWLVLHQRNAIKANVYDWYWCFGILNPKDIDIDAYSLDHEPIRKQNDWPNESPIVLMLEKKSVFVLFFFNFTSVSIWVINKWWIIAWKTATLNFKFRTHLLFSLCFFFFLLYINKFFPFHSSDRVPADTNVKYSSLQYDFQIKREQTQRTENGTTQMN